MSGVQRFLANDRNLVATATITPSTTKTATDTVTSGPHVRAGYGQIALSGAYTGAADATFDVEIVAAPGAALRISQPVFAGTGNGTLSAITAIGVTPQQITLMLASLGIPTVNATLDLGVARLVAKTAGAGGNGITIAVNLDDLEISDEVLIAMPEGLQAGASATTNPDWECGQPPLNAAGEVPLIAPRVIFGGDLSAVYRLYKRFVGGQWSYEITPPLLRTYPAGTPVTIVTGTYSAVLSGTVIETYTNLISWYDFLSALSASALVSVDGVIIDDRLPGGLGTRDLALRTAALAGAVMPAGSDYALQADLQNLTAMPDAATQKLSVRCIDITKSGAERWEIRSDLAGKFAALATTDILYDPTGTPAQFKIPRQQAATGPSATLMWNTSYAARSGAEIAPPICARALTLGVNAGPKTLTFTYKQRPAAGCDCLTAPITGNPITAYLGLKGEINVANLDPEYATRLKRLYGFRQDWIQAETVKSEPISGYSVPTISLTANAREIALADAATQIFATALSLFWENERARNEWDLVFSDMKEDFKVFFIDSTPVETDPTFTIGWVASTRFWADALTIPTLANDNGHFYSLVAINGGESHGISGSSEPTWPTNDTTVTDGALTWKDMGLRQPLPATTSYDRFNSLPRPTYALSLTASVCGPITAGTLRKLGQELKTGWLASAGYTVGGLTIPTLANDNGHYYRADVVTAITGSSEPAWPTGGTTVADGGVTWKDMGLRTPPGATVFAINTAYNQYDLVTPITPNGKWYQAINAGTSGGSEPSWNNGIGQTVTSGTVTFIDIGLMNGPELFKISRAYSLGQQVRPITVNGHWYVVTTAGTAAGSEPAWPTNGTTVTSGSVVFLDLGYYRANFQTTTLDNDASNGHYYRALSAGFQNHQDKTWPTNGTAVIDGQVVWLDMGLNVNKTRTDPAYRVQTGTQVGAPTITPASLYSSSVESSFLRRYQARLDVIGIDLGIVPGKSDGSSGSTGCWTDPGDAYWWEVPGYMPAFNNRLWYSAVRNADGEIVSTQEFAFAIACACVGDLKPDDQITVNIDNVGGRGITYQVGDEFIIPIWGFSMPATAGGITGDDTLTWTVTGSVSAFPNYALTLVEPAYSSGGLGFQLHRGAVDWALGDRFIFNVENSGKFKWRKNAGAWSAETAIAGTVALSDGLSAAFTNGIAPSFVTADAYHFSVEQPYAAAHVVEPLPLEEGWTWTGASATLDIDLGSAKSLEAVGVLIHSLPVGATLSIAGGTTSPPADWTEAFTVVAGPLVKIFSARSARYLRVSVGSATGGSLRWVWAGVPLVLSKSATEINLQRKYALERSGGVFPLARYAGAGIGGRLSWETLLHQPDIDAWVTLLSAAKAGGDQPIVVIPNYRYPGEAALVRLADDLQITDFHLFQPADNNRRLLSLDVAIEPVYL